MPNFTVSIKPDNMRGFSKSARIIERNGRHVLELFELRNLRCESGRYANHFKLMGRTQDSWKYWVYLPKSFTWDDKAELAEVRFTFDSAEIERGWFREDWNAHRNFRKWYCFFVLPAEVQIITRAQAAAESAREWVELEARLEQKQTAQFAEILEQVTALTQTLVEQTNVTPVTYGGCGLLETTREEDTLTAYWTTEKTTVPAKAKACNEVRSTQTGCYLFVSHTKRRIYVGSTNNLGYRYRTHRDGAGCRAIHEAMRLGHDFDVICLPVRSRETAYDLEQSYLDEFCRSPFFLNKNPDARSQEAYRVRKDYAALLA